VSERSQAGQASVEAVGLILLIALALTAVLAATEGRAAGLPGAIARAILPERAESPRPREPLPAATLVDRLMGADLDQFLAYRRSSERDPRLDYTTDLCTAPLLGSSGPTYDFTGACLRHDFGYRSYGRLGLIAERRLEVDQRFLADMCAHCLTRPGEQVIRCLGWARAYYRAVRAFGWIPASRYG
jgi:hypothetical protein